MNRKMTNNMKMRKVELPGEIKDRIEKNKAENLEKKGEQENGPLDQRIRKAGVSQGIKLF